jgi:predicted Zn-ribbon and HTH transcriptional regulator
MIVKKLFCCPLCDSRHIEGNAVTIEENNNKQIAVQECSCANCHAEWIDEYLLYDTRITNVKK